jgi:hypothetical protein
MASNIMECGGVGTDWVTSMLWCVVVPRSDSDPCMVGVNAPGLHLDPNCPSMHKRFPSAIQVNTG